jgi:hypothetical protein
MNSKRWVALGLVGATSAALFVVACGNSNGNGNTNQPDSSTTDSSTPDSTSNDTGTGGDTSTGNDTGTGSETSPGDDSSTDAPSSDASDASTSCAVYDAALDEASVAAGFEEVWKVYKCWSCHQEKSMMVGDAGQGIVLSGNKTGLGDSGTTFPPNLTPDPTTGIGCWTDSQLQQAILNGIDQDGGMLCPSMPKWGHALTTADGGPRLGTPMDAGTAQEIIEFLRSLPAVSNQVPDTTCAAPTDAGGG